MNEKTQQVQLINVQSEADEEISINYLISVIKRKIWLISVVFIVVMSLFVLYIATAKKQYDATALVKNPDSGAKGLASAITAMLPVGQSGDISTQIELIKSRSTLKKVVDKLDLQNKPKYANLEQNILLNRFSDMIKVSRKAQTNLIEIKAASDSPEEAMLIANTLADEYISMSKEQSRKKWEYLISQMESKLNQAKEELETSRKLLHQYESKEGIDASFGSLLLGGDMSSAKNIQEASQIISNLKSNLMQMEIRLESMRRELPEANPQIIELKDQIAKTKAKMKEEESKAIERYNKQFGLSDLAARVIFNQQVFTALVGKHEELKAQFIMQYDSAELVEPAIIPPFPSKPRKLVLLVIGIGFGGILGISSAFFSLFLEKKINSVDIIDKICNIQILGKIPSIKRTDDISKMLLSNNSDQNSWVRELYKESNRAIRTEIISQLNPISDKQGKTILITSPMQNEGKSLISANLAISFAETMSKVLLIDLNQRHPIQAKMFNVNNKRGLADLILGNTSLEETINSTDINNLYLILPGNRKDHLNLSSLLISDNMNSVLEDLKKSFDYIIIDSSPITLSSDSIAIGLKSDGLILVTRLGVTLKSALSKSEQIIQDNKLNIFGIVLNGTEPDKRFKKYYK
ncbi:TPA: polysaccharide biosynthesis tyrosine autokinase [bacterium]|nr:polysaccharide biosynthesis tyrosine autokinase [bacterium]